MRTSNFPESFTGICKARSWLEVDKVADSHGGAVHQAPSPSPGGDGRTRLVGRKHNT